MPYPGPGFPQPFQKWPHIGRQWPAYNVESDQADGLVMWMPRGGSYPGLHRHADTIDNLVFTEGGTPAWVFDDKRGWTMLFDDASNEYLVHSSPVVSSPPFTVTAWAARDDVDNSGIACALPQAETHGYYLRLNSNGTVRWYASAVSINTVAAKDDTDWHFLCGVEASTTSHAVYLDDEEKVTSSAASAPPTPTRTSIGASVRDGPTVDYPLSGRVDDVRIYNVAKTDADVEQMYLDPRELFQIPPRLWRLGAIAPPPTGQPIHLRALHIPHLRQWQPRVAS